MTMRRFVAVVLGGVLAWTAGMTPTIAADDTEAGVVAQAWKLADAGEFSAAETLLRGVLTDPDAPVTTPAAVALEMLRRLRREYSVTPEAFVTRLREDIPDVTLDDVQRWLAAGELQHRTIDGQVYIFRREPKNLFRFCPEARERRTPPAAKDPGFSLAACAARLLAADAVGTERYVCSVRHTVQYALTIPAQHPRLQPGAKVRCWLPFPQECGPQSDVQLLSSTPADAQIAPNGTPHRSIYFEQIVTDANQPVRLAAEFSFVTGAQVTELDPSACRPYDTSGVLYRTYTVERPPHILFSPTVHQLVDDIVGDEPNPLRRAQLIFGWCNDNLRYCAEHEYSTIRNISEHALTTRRGDCGVQALAFITLCRAAGVPARWQSGFSTRPGNWDMHDWAQFYVEPWGWLPADPSFGLLASDDPRVRWFYCGNLDPYRMIVNLDYGRDFVPLKTSFRSEPTDFQRGEVEIDGHNLYFDEWDWDFSVQRTHLTPACAPYTDRLAELLARYTPPTPEQEAESATEATTTQRAPREVRRARSICPAGNLSPARAEWFCKQFVGAVGADSLVYLVPDVSVADGRVILGGATTSASLRDGLVAALQAVGLDQLDVRMRLLPDDAATDVRYALCQVPQVLTYKAPAAGGGLQSQLLYGEAVFVLDAVGDDFLVQAQDGYWGWCPAAALQPIPAATFHQTLDAPAAVLLDDLTIADLRVPRGARLPVAAQLAAGVQLRLVNGDTLPVPNAAVTVLSPNAAAEQRALYALELLGVPYVFGGKSSAGLDCSGLVWSALTRQGGHPARDAWQQALSGRIVATRWDRTGLRTGDLLYFIDGAGRLYHTGIALDNTHFVHATPPYVHINSFDPADRLCSPVLNADFFVGKRP